jgi:hypothetical protein
MSRLRTVLDDAAESSYLQTTTTCPLSYVTSTDILLPSAVSPPTVLFLFHVISPTDR